MAKRAKLTYEESWYTPINIRNMLKDPQKEKEVRKEYTRLRDISQKRLKRLAAAGYTETEVYKKNVKHYPKLADIKSKNELAQRLSDLSRFISGQRSTVKGMKESERKALETYHEHGYDFVTPDNLRSFGEFMGEYRDQMLDMEYDSGEAADAYRIVEKHKVDLEVVKQNFEWFLENAEELDKLKATKASAGDIEKLKKRLSRKKR